MKYVVKLAPCPEAKVIDRHVRLTGWKAKGSIRGFSEFGVTTPDALREYLLPKWGGNPKQWRATRKLPYSEAKVFLDCARKGIAFVTPELADAVPTLPAMSPARESWCRAGVRKCERVLASYERMERPSIFLFPDPTDFFPNVLVPSRKFEVFIGPGAGSEWGFTRITRLVEAGVIMVLRDGNRLWSWAQDGTKAAAESWAQNRRLLSAAWDSHLTGLRYSLWCVREAQDPLFRFDRHAGGQVTTATLSQAVGRAREHARALWSMQNRTAEVWSYI